MTKIQSVDEMMYQLRLDVEQNTGADTNHEAIQRRFHRTAAALTRREERIKVKAKIAEVNYFRQLEKSKVEQMMEAAGLFVYPTGIFGNEDIFDKRIADLEQQLKALDGEENV